MIIDAPKWLLQELVISRTKPAIELGIANAGYLRQK
jgi:hypothetical protein